MVIILHESFIHKLSHPQATVEIYGARFCANCLWSKFPKECEGNLRFENTDATFECPADSCEAKELSFMEYFVGSCCDDGLVTNGIELLNFHIIIF